MIRSNRLSAFCFSFLSVAVVVVAVTQDVSARPLRPTGPPQHLRQHDTEVQDKLDALKEQNQLILQVLCLTLDPDLAAATPFGTCNRVVFATSETYSGDLVELCSKVGDGVIRRRF